MKNIQDNLWATTLSFKMETEKMNKHDAAILVVKAKTSDEISQTLINAGVDDDFLDEMVLDCVGETGSVIANQEEDVIFQEEALDQADQEGSDISNSGISGQVDFLVVTLGPDDTREKISNLLKEA